jgi:hypothetical protein
MMHAVKYVYMQRLAAHWRNEAKNRAIIERLKSQLSLKNKQGQPPEFRLGLSVFSTFRNRRDC